jgi:hypothetical protein
MDRIIGSRARQIPTIYWNDERLTRIKALYLASRDGLSWFDVVYCQGELADGRECRVLLPFDQLLKGRETITVVRHAKREGVFAKGLRILDAIRYTEQHSDTQLAA